MGKQSAPSQGGGEKLDNCTNNEWRAWRTALCIYRDGKKLVDGDLAGVPEDQKRIEANWRLVTIEIDGVS